MSRWKPTAFVLMYSLFIPAAAHAQGAIAGLVRDSSGGILPGVTVEASSPALIEKVRIVVTDGAGQYQIIDLRPGVYRVTFTLPGFNTLVREGVELTGAFTATVNAELSVGAVQETITVTAESPTVDVQSTRRSNVVTADVIDALPSARSQYLVTQLIPGAIGGNQDVGGTRTMQITTYAIHGGRAFDQRLMINGVTSRNFLASGWASNFVPDMSSASEVVTSYATGTAETIGGGIDINVIPKEGGNTYSGQAFASGATGSFQSNNVDQALIDAGLGTPNELDKVFDVNAAFGGPVFRDTLWFYATIRAQESSQFVAGSAANRNGGDLTKWSYDRDPSNPGHSQLRMIPTGGVRVTWQATPRNRFAFSADPQSRHWILGTAANNSPEYYPDWQFFHETLATATWTSPVTNRLLLDARFANHAEGFVDKYPDIGDPYRRAIPVVDQGTGYNYRGKGNCCGLGIFSSQDAPAIMQAQASLSYVTGSHTFKVGFQNDFGTSTSGQRDNEFAMNYTFLNGVPVQLEQHAIGELYTGEGAEPERWYPLEQTTHLGAELGIYVQDRWTIGKATVNAGLRFEHFANDFPEHRLGPARFVPDRNLVIPATEFRNMNDISPRVGFAYDLFGDGKTSLKAGWGKYLIGLSPATGNPVSNLSTRAFRSWTPSLPVGHPDYYTPQCDLLDPAANGDCGALTDSNFGTLRPSTAIDPETTSGFGNRPWNQEFSVSVQHEVAPRVAVDVGYFRRWYGNFTVTDNRAVGPNDFVTYSVTAPVDSRLELSGQELTGLVELRPQAFGRVDNYETFADNFGKQIEHWNGIDISVNARPREGVVLQGGLSTGRTSTDNCDLRANLPEVAIAVPLSQCHVDTKFLTQVKLLGAYLIPRIDVQFGVTFQSVPGPQISGNYFVSSAAAGVPLAPGFRVVNVVPPGSRYVDHVNQLDLRIAKILRMGGTRATLSLDLANALNSNAYRGVNNTFGSNWLNPTQIIDARLVKLAAQLDF